MNIHHNYALTFRSETNQFVRKRNEVTRLAFFSSALLVDVAIIVSMAWLTGVSYHLFIYGHTGELRTHLTVGIVAAAVFVVSNLFRQEYHLSNFFEFKPHLRRT